MRLQIFLRGSAWAVIPYSWLPESVFQFLLQGLG